MNQIPQKNIEIDFVESIKRLWLERFLITKITFAFAIISLVYALNLDNVYRATVTLLPQASESTAGKFSGIAAIAGINLNSTSPSNEAFYADLIKSDKMLNKLIETKWHSYIKNKDVYLYDLLEIEVDSSHYSPKEKLYFDTRKYLKEEAIYFSTSEENGIMTLAVSMPLEPQLAADIANWLVNEVHVFNESYRQKKNLEDLQSTEQQLSKSKKELTRAEENLKRFQETNKNYLQSTALQLEYARLQREVVTESTVYTEVRKQVEIAKIDLEKSKSSITVLDQASIPVLKHKPKRGLICIIITLFGGFIAVCYVFIRTNYSHIKL